MPTQTVEGVTLCAVSSVGLTATLAAMRHSLEQVGFERALFLSHAQPEELADPRIEWRQIDRIASRADYSRFILHELADHIATPHVLVIQWDGFIRAGGQWRDQFLACDYIGAVWPQFSDGMTVGNGGFSLRSRKLLEATRHIPAGSEPEDVLICRTHRHVLERDYDIRFADADTARLFSYERERSTKGEFGFHGAYNLFAELPRDMMRQLIGSLEAGVVGSRESVELLIGALASGDIALARTTSSHVFAHPNVFRRMLRGARSVLKGLLLPEPVRR